VSADISLEESRDAAPQARIEKLLVVDDEYNLKGDLITIKDIEEDPEVSKACKDALGRLRVGAAVGILDGRSGSPPCSRRRAGRSIYHRQRPTAHSAIRDRRDRDTKANFPGMRTRRGGGRGHRRGRRGAHRAGGWRGRIQGGRGPGSICSKPGSSRPAVGVPLDVGHPDCVRTADRHGLPVVADGGIKYSATS
jgi:IMP dehydrogenase